MTVTINGTTGVAGVDGTASTPAIQGNDTNTGIFFPAADTIAFAEGGVECARFDSSGNLGIGTSSPSTRLHVFSTGSVGIQSQTSGAGAGFFQAKNSSGSSILGQDSTGGYLLTDYAAPFLFYTNNAERMRIDSSGQLLIGTTSALNAGTKLSVYNTTSGGGGAAIGYGSTAGQFRVMYLLQSNGGFYFDSGTNAAYLNSAGAWTNASDARLKNSITDIKYGLSAVLNTQPRSYKMNDLEGDYIGFVAQELQNVIPEVVSGDSEKQLGVDYGSLVAVAFKAIQELKAEFDSYKATHP